MSADSPLFGRSILLVEDEMMVAWLLADILADLGCTVVGPAASVDQALALINVEAIDAVVLDINLNGQPSYPVADALVERGTPFVISTGYDPERLHPGYRGLPVLQKPFHPAELADALASLLAPAAPAAAKSH